MHRRNEFLKELCLLDERNGDTRLFPRTAQLPIVHKILSDEFLAGVPSSIARADHRADSYKKILLYCYTMDFCLLGNSFRRDGVHVFPVVDKDLVTRLAVVQKVTTSLERGLRFRIRLHVGDDFWPDIHLAEKSLVIESHALSQFSVRVGCTRRNDTVDFLQCLLQSRPLVMRTNGWGKSLVVPHTTPATTPRQSVLAFPFDETEEDYFIKTCLRAQEISRLEPLYPLVAPHFHYGPEYSNPQSQPGALEHFLDKLTRMWRNGIDAPAENVFTRIRSELAHENWAEIARQTEALCERTGCTQGSRMEFADDVWGPYLIFHTPPRPPQKNPKDVYWDQVLADVYGPPSAPDRRATRPGTSMHS